MNSAPTPVSPSRLRDRLRHDAAEGSWSDGPRRYLVLRPDSLMGALRSLDPATRDTVFAAFAQSLQHHGGDSLRAYAASVGGDAQALIAATVDAAADLGWGRWEIAPAQGALELVVHDSPFAAGWLASQPSNLGAGPQIQSAAGGAQAPAAAAGGTAPAVCAPIRGMFAALAKELGLADAQVSEIACAAQGHASCRFRATPARAGEAP